MDFGQIVRGEDELRAVVPAPGEGAPALRKQIDHLDEHCREFIARSPFLVLATAAADGTCDTSPRGGPPGFVRVLDERRLLVPEYPGNRRADSPRNLLENPRASLIFMIPRLRETLRVTGRACITRDAGLLAELAVNGKPPALGIGVEVEEAFIHCAKAFIRSALWQPETWPDEVPSASLMLRDHMDIPDLTLDAVEARLDESYKKTLY
ncbi:MAG TPA: pyridoxamine 5'-phosphate oxidase family protein [Thermoleophilaceae bacterium]|nr:pyridoxamine 5'-phosphate oxidase family protein [Thermoleophilaceae bacterium]